MKVLIILVCSIMIAGSATNQSAVEQEWNNYKINHRKTYKNDNEEAHRKKVFHRHHDKILKHNEKYKNGLVSYKIGLNEYSDLTHEEFTKNLNGFLGVNLQTDNIMEIQPTSSMLGITTPASIDWRNSGAVTNVKNQGNCQSCYAFSATGALEGQYAIKKGKKVTLSEQNIIDCSKSFGNNGCNKGLMHLAFNYIKSNNGIDTDASYPYEGVDNFCRYKSASFGATNIGYIRLQSGDEVALKNAVSTVGPISVALDATDLLFYSSGIYYNQRCTKSINHAVLLIGYGTDPKTKEDYWLIKNSWGKTWGQGGYGMIKRNANNHCGIATYAVYPLV